MAEATPLKFSKKDIWNTEGYCYFNEIYDDENKEKRAQVYDALCELQDGKYVFSVEKWQNLHDEYAKYNNVNEAVKKLEEKYPHNETLQRFISTVDGAPRNEVNSISIFEQIKDNPEQKEKFAFLSQLQETFSQSGKKGESHLEMRDGKQVLRINNLNDTGLSFAIMDNLSIVFTENKTMTQAQVAALASYFDTTDLQIDNFNDAGNINVVETEQSGKQIGSLETVFKQYNREELEKLSLDELYALQVENEKKGIPNFILDDVIWSKDLAQKEAANDGKDGQDGQNGEDGKEGKKDRWYDLDIPDPQQQEGSQSAGQYSSTEQVSAQSTGETQNSEEPAPSGAAREPSFADELSDLEPNYSMSKMKSKIYARAEIMRISKRCIVSRRLPDGSIAIAFYGSEDDVVKDCKMDPKTGVVRHTKRVGFIVKPGRPPCAKLYLPQGAKMESAYAKAILSGFKSCGYPYFKMPSAADGFGGDVFNAFLEAAGDQLMVPTGINLGADHLRVMLEVAEDKKKGDKADTKDMLEFKMRLIEQINEQIAGKSGDKEVKVREIRDRLVGDVRLQLYHDNTFPAIKNFINDGIQGRLPNQDAKWSQIDLGCAYKAFAEITKEIADGRLNFKHTEDQTSYLMDLMQQRMQKAKPDVEKTFNIHLGGSAETGDYGDVKESAIAGKCNNALAAIKEDMNRTLETVAGCGSEFAKFELKINERGVLAPKTNCTQVQGQNGKDVNVYTIKPRPIPGVASGNSGNTISPIQNRGGTSR